ncbi:hypothetical protein ACR3K2_23430 [Cryptosporidium serpentis]
MSVDIENPFPLKKLAESLGPNSTQQSAIYWEVGHRTYLPFFKLLWPTFYPKVMDHKIRKWLGLGFQTESLPFVFYSGSDNINYRKYYGDPLISEIVSVDTTYHFSFYPVSRDI